MDKIAELTDRVNTLVNETDLLRVQVRQRPLKWTTQIYDLGEEGYTLTAPIPIIVEEYASDEPIIARFPEAELFGEGATESEAIDTLKSEILDLFDELSEMDRQEMGKLPQSWRRILGQLISQDSN